MKISTNSLPEMRGRLTRLEESHAALLSLPRGESRTKALKANYARMQLLRRAIQRREKLLDTPL